MKPTSSHYAAEAFLKYLEDMLLPEERALVEEHLRGCGQCSPRLKELEAVISGMPTHRMTLFCPHPSELYEFAETGTDPGGEITDHARRCDLCREDLSLFRDACGERPIEMPSRVRQAFEDLCLPKTTPPRFPHVRAWAPKFREHAQCWLMRSYLACALAFILIVIVVGAHFYPRKEMKPILGVSSVEWKPTGHIQLMAPVPDVDVEKPRVAIMLYIKDFKRPPDQHKLDAWYR